MESDLEWANYGCFVSGWPPAKSVSSTAQKSTVSQRQTWIRKYNFKNMIFIFVFLSLPPPRHNLCLFSRRSSFCWLRIVQGTSKLENGRLPGELPSETSTGDKADESIEPLRPQQIAGHCLLTCCVLICSSKIFWPPENGLSMCSYKPLRMRSGNAERDETGRRAPRFLTQSWCWREKSCLFCSLSNPESPVVLVETEHCTLGASKLGTQKAFETLHFQPAVLLGILLKQSTMFNSGYYWMFNPGQGQESGISTPESINLYHWFSSAAIASILCPSTKQLQHVGLISIKFS